MTNTDTSVITVITLMMNTGTVRYADDEHRHLTLMMNTGTVCYADDEHRHSTLR